VLLCSMERIPFVNYGSGASLRACQGAHAITYDLWSTHLFTLPSLKETGVAQSSVSLNYAVTLWIHMCDMTLCSQHVLCGET